MPAICSSQPSAGGIGFADLPGCGGSGSSGVAAWPRETVAASIILSLPALDLLGQNRSLHPRRDRLRGTVGSEAGPIYPATGRFASPLGERVSCAATGGYLRR